MNEFISTVTSKGQVTIPRDVRRHLGVGASDKISFVICGNGAIEVRPVRFRVADLRGIIPALPGRETVDFDDQIAEAFDDVADRICGNSTTGDLFRREYVPSVSHRGKLSRD